MEYIRIDNDAMNDLNGYKKSMYETIYLIAKKLYSTTNG
jgi:hypothetical protein